MSTLTSATPSTDPQERPRPSLRLSTTRVIRSELLRLTGLRSTWVMAATIVAVLVGIGMISANLLDAADSPVGALSTTLTGTTLAILLVGSFGAVVGARDFASGAIRTALAAVPRRTTLLLARATALAVLLVPTLVLGYAGAAVGGGVLLDAHGIDTAALTDPRILGLLAGSVLYLTCVGLIGLAVGLLLRSTAGAVAAMMGLLLVLPVLVAMLAGKAALWLPSSAGQAVTSLGTEPGGLSPAAGAALLAGWVCVALVAAGVTLTRRDA